MSFEPVSLEDLAAPIKYAIVGGPFGSNLISKDYVLNGVPVIRGQNMGDRYVGGVFVFVSPEKAAKLGPNKARPGDLVFTQRGTLGQVSIVPTSPFHEYIVSQSQMKVTVDLKKADPNYLYYVFRSQEQLEYIKNSAIQTGVPHTNLGILKKTPIRLPSLGVQKEVAKMLVALDERIELLRETNATLEAIAQAIFKSWFVDFDPVRAKMEGRTPEGMDVETAALFPGALVESELGLIPKGWHIGQLQDLLVLQRGFDLPAPSRVPGDYPIIAASGHSGMHNKAMVKGPGVITGRSGVLGRVFLELDDFWPLNTSLWVKEFRASKPCFAFELLRLLDLNSFNAGSAVPTLNRNHIHGLPYCIPDRRCIEAFEAIALPLHYRIKMNMQNVEHLAELRDTLMPRLISGQLLIPDPDVMELTQAIAA